MRHWGNCYLSALMSFDKKMTFTFLMGIHFGLLSNWTTISLAWFQWWLICRTILSAPLTRPAFKFMFSGLCHKLQCSFYDFTLNQPCSKPFLFFCCCTLKFSHSLAVPTNTSWINIGSFNDGSSYVFHLNIVSFN